VGGVNSGRDPQWAFKSPRTMLGWAPEWRAARRSYSSFKRSEGLLGEECTTRRFQIVVVGVCFRVQGRTWCSKSGQSGIPGHQILETQMLPVSQSALV
jgi:hypothetical protein